MLSAGRLFLLSVALRATLVHTTPTLSFPINAQVPPVARVGEPFCFVFSSRTFTSSSGSSLAYSLTNSPSWLSLDSNARTLSGTPQDGDIASGTVVGVSLTLVATDSTGFTTDDATLVVSRNEAPSVQIPISDQLQTFGHYSEPSSIIYSPEEYFQFAFATDTFAAPDSSLLNYYSVLTDNSPLPAWLSFDASSLAFAGTSPPFSSLIEPPQTFSVKLIASDVTGFSATSVNFSIVVGTHTLTNSQSDVILNATVGESLAYTGLVGSIEVDGKTADSSQVKATTEDLPTWLSFDSASWNIGGTPPATAESTSFMVIMEDAYADVLNVTFSVQLTRADSLFQSTFPALSVTPGESFSFDLTPYLLDPSKLDVTTDVQPATSWISWDTSSLTLSGDAPSSAPKSVVDVIFTVAQKSSAKSKRDGTSQSQQLIIEIEPALETASSSATSPSPSSTSSSTESSSPIAAASADNTSSAPYSTKWTIIAIVISVVAAFAIIASLCLWCCARRKKKATAKRFTRSTSSTDPEDIHTQGHPIHSPNSTSPNEKAAKKPALTIWQANNSTGRLPPPTPASGATPAAGFSLGLFHNNSTTTALGQQQQHHHHHHQQHPPSTAASTPVKKVKDYFHSSFRRSLRVIHVLPTSRLSSRGASTGSSLHYNESRSHYDGDFLPDLGLASSASVGAPVLPLPAHHHGSSSQISFRDALESSLPERSGGGTSLQITPETAYLSNAEQRRRAERRMSSRRRSKGKSVQGRIATPGFIVRRQNSTADPFTDTVAASNTPIPSTSAHDPNANHFRNTHPTLLQPTTSPVTPPSPSAAPTDPKPLRPTHSQKSFISTASSSLSLSGKLGRKFSAQARGAWQLTLLQSSGRRTRAALRSSKKARRNKKRGPVLEDDESTAAARSVSSPTMAGRSASALDSRSEMGSRSGARTADLYSPRAWPQPATTTRNVTAPLERQGAISPLQQHTIPKRRPVPSYPPQTGSPMLPSPLTPVRSDDTAVHDKKAVSTPSGLVILNATYAGIAASSPYGGSSSPFVEGSGGGDNWEVLGVSSPATTGSKRDTGGVGRAISSDEGEEGDGNGDRRKSEGGSSGANAYV